jgi:NAD(P)H-binding
MRVTGSSRLVVVSAAPVASDDRRTTLPHRLVAPLLRMLLRGLYADMTIMEEAIRRSGTDWTIMRPPWLSDGPRTGTWRKAKDATCVVAPHLPGLPGRRDPGQSGRPGMVKATVAIGY